MKDEAQREEREVLASFVQACDRLEPLRPEASLLLGCSAGGDSMALLDLVHRLADERSWKVTVAHFDHALRPASMAEADFVAERCRELNIPLIAEQWDAPDAAESPPSEEAMREARYAFFVRAMDRSGAETLVLAHQADDRAETFLMRLLAGSGPTGLASIRSVETVKGLTVARPLLGIRRERLRDYLRSRRLSWVDDPTNEDVTYKRAWVRRDILPLFNERMGLEVIPRIVRAAELAEQESGAMRQACEILLGQITAPAEPPATEALLIHHEIWRRAGEPLRLQLLREWLWRLRTSPHPPGMAAVREALNFAERAADGSRLRTIERLHLLKRAGKLVAYPPEPTS